LHLLHGSMYMASHIISTVLESAIVLGKGSDCITSRTAQEELEGNANRPGSSRRSEGCTYLHATLSNNRHVGAHARVVLAWGHTRHVDAQIFNTKGNNTTWCKIVRHKMSVWLLNA